MVKLVDKTANQGLTTKIRMGNKAALIPIKIHNQQVQTKIFKIKTVIQIPHKIKMVNNKIRTKISVQISHKIKIKTKIWVQTDKTNAVFQSLQFLFIKVVTQHLQLLSINYQIALIVDHGLDKLCWINHQL